MAAIKFVVHGNSTNAYLNSGAGKTPLIIDTAGGGPPTVVADATAIGGFAIDYNGGGVTKGHIFPGFVNSQQTGLISVLARVAPVYSGSPAGSQSYISVGGPRLLNATPIQLLQLDHLSNGNLVLTLTDIIGGGAVSTVLGAWSPVAGTYYDIVAVWNGTTGANAFKLYIDAVLFAQFTSTRVWTAANNEQSTILIGAGQNQVQQGLYKLNEYVLWDYVINPTAGGLNLNGAGRTAFVDTTGLVLDPNLSVDPGQPNVRSLQGYTIAGVAKVGSAAIPTASQTLSGVPVDATVGNVVQATTTDVRSGSLYGPSSSLVGLAEIPSPDDVLLGVPVDATVGDLVVPTASQILEGTAFGANGSQTGTLVQNQLVQALLIGQAPPGTSAIVLEITQGDTALFNLKALEGPDGLAFDLTGAVFETTIKGTAGDVVIANSAHTAAPNQVTNKGEFTMAVTILETDAMKLGSGKEIVTKVVQGASTIYFHGAGVLTIIKKAPTN